MAQHKRTIGGASISFSFLFGLHAATAATAAAAAAEATAAAAAAAATAATATNVPWQPTKPFAALHASRKTVDRRIYSE